MLLNLNLLVIRVYSQNIKIISRGSYHTHRSHQERMSCLLRFRHRERCSRARMCDIKHWFCISPNNCPNQPPTPVRRLNSTLLLRIPISINRAVCTRLYYNNSQINRFADKQTAIKVTPSAMSNIYAFTLCIPLLSESCDGLERTFDYQNAQLKMHCYLHTLH